MGRTKTRVSVATAFLATAWCLAAGGCGNSGNDQHAPDAAVGDAGPFSVDVYEPEHTCDGTTLLPDNHDLSQPRIIEVDMSGEIVWEYLVPDGLKHHTNPGFDVELLSNDNIMYVLPGHGIIEIDRAGEIVWTYLDHKLSHDADRLADGNTIMVYGDEDTPDDPQVKEVDPDGEIVWEWYARDDFYIDPLIDVWNQGWSHTNAVTRLGDGNTLITPRNFHILVVVDPLGELVSVIGQGVIHDPHEPQVLPSHNILVMTHTETTQEAVIIAPENQVVWSYAFDDPDTWPVRDANKLPNGNTLITAATQIVEVTEDGELVWRLVLNGVEFDQDNDEGASKGFYKAERIAPDGC